MSMKNSKLAPAIIIGVLATAAIIGGVAISGVLDKQPSPNITPTPTQSPTVSPTPTSTSPPTASPTPTPKPTAKPTASPTPTAIPTPSPSPSPSPTPEPVATAFQNATLTDSYNQTSHTMTWLVNGTLVNTDTEQGISGLTISVVDATNSTSDYGTTTTDDNGYFEYSFDVMPFSIQLVFAGNEQYLAVTSSSLQPPA